MAPVPAPWIRSRQSILVAAARTTNPDGEGTTALDVPRKHHRVDDPCSQPRNGCAPKSRAKMATGKGVTQISKIILRCRSLVPEVTEPHRPPSKQRAEDDCYLDGSEQDADRRCRSGPEPFQITT